MPAESSRAVFISYASEDAAAALRLCTALRAAGIEVWFDRNELAGGDAWDAKIRSQIARCALFVPVISAHTQARLEGYFRIEWKLAAVRSHAMADERAFILPVVIDATRDAEARVPAEFRAVQWTRLPEAAAGDAFCARVRQLLAGFAAPPPAAAPAPSPGQHAATRETAASADKPRSRRTFLAAAAGGAVLLGAGALWLRRPVEKSIAVLPFVNLGPDKADEYLGDGLTEELLHVLGKVKGLRVPGRTSSFAFKGRNEEGIFRTVGAKLGVSTVLEGSVRKLGDKVRVTAQLINVADGFHLWSETYDGDMQDILRFQSEVARQVVQALGVKLGFDETKALTSAPTRNPEAHRLYLLGRHHFHQTSIANWAIAENYFKQAIDLDPGYALAYCGLADTYGWMGGSVMRGREAWTLELAAARKAVDLAPQLADARVSLALALSGFHDWAGVEREFQHALKLNPNLAFAYNQVAFIRAVFGRFDEAIALAQKAAKMEPLSLIMDVDVAAHYYWARRDSTAREHCRRVLEIHPNAAFIHNLLGWINYSQGDSTGALAAFARGKALDSQLYFDSAIAYVQARSGNRAAAEAKLREWEELATTGRFVPPSIRVTLYLGIGDKEKAYEWLDRCYEDLDSWCWYWGFDRQLDPLRGEPRFQALLAKVRGQR
jgi:TolB-like protein/Tfp pilus assembly protein PilF